METVRVVAVIEAATVTGPAKNLLQFARRAKLQQPFGARLSVATFYRFRGGAKPVAPANPFLDAARAAGVEVDVITERFRFDPGALTQLARILKRRGPDIVQTHGIKAHFLARLAGARRESRWIAFHHGYTTEDLKMRVYNQLNRWSLPAADRVVTVCGPFADALARAGVARSRLRVLPNSIDPPPHAGAEEARPLRERLGIGPEERVILSIGRFSREKAHLDLIPAARHLARLLPDLQFRLVLVGDGPERPRVERAAAEMPGRIIFAGQQRDVRPYYALADLFVLPSHSEGSPNVLLEAMAAGVPIVATAVGGVPETVAHEESALLAPAGDSSALAAAMARLLTGRALAASLASQAAEAVATHYSPEAYCRSLLKIYQELTSS